MEWSHLKAQWLGVLAAASAAVDAATAAHALAMEVAAAERKRLAAERVWVEATWAKLDRAA